MWLARRQRQKAIGASRKGISLGRGVSSVPQVMVGRLSLYLRELQNLLREGQQTTSSTQLGRLLGFSDAQVRKDLAQRQIKGGIIAVPGVAAQQVAETLVATGLEGVLNLPPSH